MADPAAQNQTEETGAAAAAADAARAEAARLIQKAVRNSIVSDTGREISVVNLSGDVMLQKHVSSSLTVPWCQSADRYVVPRGFRGILFRIEL